jgi:hypothetical protein
MANLQAIGFDGETIIYLLADGTGTDLDPFISKFALTDETVTAIANILPDTYPVSGTVTVANSVFGASQSGEWLVGITNSSIAVTGTFWQATQPVSLASLPSLPAGNNPIGSITNTSFGISGTLPAFASTPTFNIGTIGSIATTTNQETTNTRLSSILTQLSSVTLASEAGYLTYRNTALTSTPQTIKSGAGSLMGFNVINVNTTVVYVKFYNATSPIVGTTTPSLTIMIPPSDGVTPGMFYQEPSLIPLEVFSTAISVAVVTGLADSSTTAPSAAIHFSARYK